MEPISDTSKPLAIDRQVVATNGAGATEAPRLELVEGTPNAIQAEEQTHERQIMLRDVRNNPKVRVYLQKANEQMAAIGYSEHGLRHSALVAGIARNILLELGHDPRRAEIAAIAGYLHDIGNCVHRIYHPQIGATMAFQILDQMGMDTAEIATIIGAIGNHEEPEGVPINTVTAAVIIADKSDVHYTRVQNPDPETYDIHDRVNNAVQKSYIFINKEEMTITLDLIIDVTKATVMEYFEIFVSRMIMCHRSAAVLGCKFRLIINGVEL
jgi:uncharacterized protein